MSDAGTYSEEWPLLWSVCGDLWFLEMILDEIGVIVW